MYSFNPADTQETSARRPVEATTAPLSPAPGTAALPPLVTDPSPVAAAPTAPVRVPVTVLNATAVNGLAADIAATVAGAGWETPGVGDYVGGDVAVSTVFFAEGDETQRQAAVQLIEQFPQLSGPAPRFFDVPDVAAPGLVVVATGDWQP